MARPSPVPKPGALVVKKGLKILHKTAGAMPGPVSLPSTITRSPSERALTWIPVHTLVTALSGAVFI